MFQMPIIEPNYEFWTQILPRKTLPNAPDPILSSSCTSDARLMSMLTPVPCIQKIDNVENVQQPSVSLHQPNSVSKALFKAGIFVFVLFDSFLTCTSHSQTESFISLGSQTKLSIQKIQTRGCKTLLALSTISTTYCFTSRPTFTPIVHTSSEPDR